jgi:hypothetical protein
VNGDTFAIGHAAHEFEHRRVAQWFAFLHANEDEAVLVFFTR